MNNSREVHKRRRRPQGCLCDPYLERLPNAMNGCGGCDMLKTTTEMAVCVKSSAGIFLSNLFVKCLLEYVGRKYDSRSQGNLVDFPRSTFTRAFMSPLSPIVNAAHAYPHHGHHVSCRTDRLRPLRDGGAEQRSSTPGWRA